MWQISPEDSGAPTLTAVVFGGQIQHLPTSLAERLFAQATRPQKSYPEGQNIKFKL